jgi:PIN domain-containing protein
MLVSPLPGVSPFALLMALRDLESRTNNLHSVGVGSPAPANRLWGYLTWVDNTARQLSSMTDDASIRHLVRTPGYELLLANGADLVTMSSGGPVTNLLNTMLNNELIGRVEALRHAITALEDDVRRWQADELVVLDTNVYLEHEQKLEELDLAGLLDAADRPVRLLVPITVVDELDRAKRNDRNRWRAAYSLAHIITGVRDRDGVLRDAKPGSGPEQPDRGRVTVEVVLDPPGHRRMPESDDEIADRAHAVQLRSGATVTMITFDTGMSLRANHAALTVIKLDTNPGPEPAPRVPSTRTPKS